MWLNVAVLLLGFALGWIASKADFEQVLDLLTVLRECVRNLGRHPNVAAHAQQSTSQEIDRAAPKTV